MAWKQLEPTAPHLAYLILPAFLISYALFSLFIRNRLHLSEPPLAVLIGIISGPHGTGIIDPKSWGFYDNITQEFTRIIVGISCFSIGVELPKYYVGRHFRDLLVMLLPVMSVSWLVSAGLVYAVLKTDFPTALIIGACLTPTDPVLAASIISNSQFSTRVPKRIKHLLSAESGCNDGTSFPFLYFGLYILTKSTVAERVQEWFLITILYQCALAIMIGLLIGTSMNRILRFADSRGYVMEPAFFVFYLLLAIFAIGVGSSLGSDDFLIAFGAGYGFARDGWFATKTKRTHLPNIIDMLLNSTMFVYFGAIIPWDDFSRTWSSSNTHASLSVGRLLALLGLILLFRRIPIVLAMKRFMPAIHTYYEALFVGHFGPMGLGALFLAMEARAQLETDTSVALPHPPHHGKNRAAIEAVWPVMCFIVLGSTMVHGCSAALISLWGHFSRDKEKRADMVAGETDPLMGMNHEGQEGESEPSGSEDDASVIGE